MKYPLLSSPSSSRFLAGLVGVCLLYFCMSLLFNHYAMLGVDEFWFAHRIYQYKEGLPYRDFAPYKTVLGYYLLLPPMLIFQHLFSTLLFTKDVLAAVNTLLLFTASLWISRFFSPRATFLSLLLLIFTETMLAYSTNIRVDLLAYWFCFFSLLFLLENRFLWAGCLIALGFMTSQKTIWYFFASNFTLFCYWISLERNKTFAWNIIKFNVLAGFLVFLYLIFWAAFSQWQVVIASVFGEAVAMYQLDWYEEARKLFWSIILAYNPLVFLLSPLTLISLVVTYPDDTAYSKRLFVIIYSLTILLCLIPYKQIFPYYMQITSPLFLILYAAFFSWLFNLFKASELRCLLTITHLWKIIAIYASAVCLCIVYFNLPCAYLLLIGIPICLTIYMMKHTELHANTRTLLLNLMAIIVVFVSGLYPLTLFSEKLFNLNGDYQKATIQTMQALLDKEDGYVAGIELLYNKTQSIAGMRHLDGTMVDYLYAPSAKLRKVMLPSLYATPDVTSSSVISALAQSSVKFYVNNYRMRALPANIKSYLASQYAHYWGSIYLYAPAIPGGQQKIHLKFSGTYRIESSRMNQVKLNHKIYSTNVLIDLPKGDYISQADMGYRLKLIPNLPATYTNPAFQQDSWEKVIF